MENHAYSEIIGSTAAPYVNSLLSAGSLGSNYHGVTHPSLPNYLALVGGSTYGITTDCITCWVSASSIADTLEASGASWKAYMESMPSACYVGDSYPYAQKHNPFIYFNNIRTNSSRCRSHVVPFTQLGADLQSAASTPAFGFITPNMCNDMHDCAVATGDSWLKNEVPVILGSPAFTTQRSLLAITWDEDDLTTSNQVPLILLGYGVGGRSAAYYNHYSLLHTIETARSLSTLTTNDAGAGVMADLVGTTASSSACGAVALSASPASTMYSGSQATFTAVATGCPSPRYEFWRRAATSSAWTLVQGYSSSATLTWTATSPGGYYISVWARDASSAKTFDANGTVAFTVRPPACGSVSLSASPASPQIAGARPVFVAAAAGCSGSTPLYEFWRRPATSATWTMIRSYATAGSVTWDTSGVSGMFYLSVWAKDSNSATTTFDANATTAYTVNPASCASVAMGATPATGAVTFTATAAGCSNPNPQFEFWILAGSSWQVVQPWSTGTSWTWSTAGVAPGTYHFGVWVRDAASPGVNFCTMGRYDAFTGAAYALP